MADLNFAGTADKHAALVPDDSRSWHGKEDSLQGAAHQVRTGPAQLSPADEKILSKAYLKLDLFFLSSLTVIYWLNFLDRANIGNARAAGAYKYSLPWGNFRRISPPEVCLCPTGMQKDLRLSNHEYSVGLTITYVSFTVAEWPSVMLCKKL